jgi:hypothetical protein
MLLRTGSWGGSWGEGGYIRVFRQLNATVPEVCGTDTTPGDGDGCPSGPATIQVRTNTFALCVERFFPPVFSPLASQVTLSRMFFIFSGVVSRCAVNAPSCRTPRTLMVVVWSKSSPDFCHLVHC